MRPIWKKVQSVYPKIELIDYDYDMDNDKILKWKIGKKLPVAIILDKNGQEITRIIGEKSKKEVISLIEEIVVNQNEEC